MNKIKKTIRLMLLFTMLLVLFSVPASAGNTDFYFNLAVNGRTMTRDPNSANSKTNPSSGWVYRVDYINFTDTSKLSAAYGLAFTPMKYWAASGGYKVAGTLSWTKTTGRKTGSYTSNFGTAGEYFLGARMDDYLTGSAKSIGAWNADSW